MVVTDDKSTCRGFVSARRLTALASGAIACWLLAGASTAGAAAPVMSGTLDLAAVERIGTSIKLDPAAADQGGTKITSAARGVAFIGDVDKDGNDDVAIGVPDADPAGRRNAGSVFVVLGPLKPGAVDLPPSADRGYRIDGRTPGGRLGASIAPLGDTDGDGLADFAAGAPFASDGSPAAAGVVYLVPGTKSRERIDLAGDAGTSIVRLLGAAAGDATGWSLAPLDVPGSGAARGLVIGAPLADPSGRIDAGSVYVLPVLPARATAPPGLLGPRGAIALQALAPASYRIDGAIGGGKAGTAVGTAADMTRDGLAEVLVGAPRVGVDDAGTAAGAAYVAPAGTPGGSVDLAAPAATGMAIGGEPGSGLGASIAGIGDVNGDGVPDVAIGAPTASPDGRLKAGSAFVVFGRAAQSPIAATATQGSVIRLDGANRLDRFGSKVAAAGAGGDGDPGLLVTAPQAETLGRANSGATYAVLGSALRRGSVNIGLLEHDGVRMAGPSDADLAGTGLAVGVDPAGDARPAVLLRGRSSASLFELPKPPESPAKPARLPGDTCTLARDVQIVVDDSGSMRLGDPARLRLEAIGQMITKLRTAAFNVGAIELGRRALQVFPTLAVPKEGIVDAAELATIRGLERERIRNDAGAAALDTELAAIVEARPLVGALILITDAADAPPPVALANPGKPVYVVALASGYKQRSAARLRDLADSSGGEYFEDVDAAALPGALSIVEAALNCEQALRTEVVATGDAAVAAPPAAVGGATTDPETAVADAAVTPAKDTTIDARVPQQLDTVTLTLEFDQPSGAKGNCLDASAVGLEEVEVFAGGADEPAQRATGDQLRAALSGRETPVGPLRMRGNCADGSLLLRVSGLQRISPVTSQVQAAGPKGSPCRYVRYNVKKGKGKGPSKLTATTRGGKKKKKGG